MASNSESGKVSPCPPILSVSSPARKELEPIRKVLSDAGAYCYCGICAISLHDLFPDVWDCSFNEECLQFLIKHLQLPEQVEPVMMTLLTGEKTNIDPYVQVLHEEEVLKGNCIRIIEDLIIFSVHRGTYDARLRVLVLHIAWLLRVPLPLVEIYEESVVDMLSNEVWEKTEEEKKEDAKRTRNRKIKRYLMIGIATVGGGAVIGLTGGLAAPFVAAGAGAIIGGAGAAALGSTAGIAFISSIFGMAGAGLTGYKMQKRVGDIEEFAFETLTPGQQLHITLAISGWLTDKTPDCFQEPWRCLLHSREQYCLRYESDYLLELGKAMDYLLSFAVSMAAQEALKYTILSGLITAMMWPVTLVTVAGVIDNPWGVCIRRSAEVGKHLADVLLTRQHGRRPITLMGFSLGARVIFYCLQELAKKKGCEGIVENAVLLGAPISGSSEAWKPLNKVVSGRIVNGYCRGDWLLKFLYRTSSATMKIAGLGPIRWNNRKMCNVDLSDIVEGHMDYSKKMDIILKAIGIQTTDEVTDADSQLRKSHSDIPVVRTGMKSMKKSKSENDLRLCMRNIPDAPLSVSHKLISISLESVLSKTSTSSGIVVSQSGNYPTDFRIRQSYTQSSKSMDSINSTESFQSRSSSSVDNGSVITRGSLDTTWDELHG